MTAGKTEVEIGECDLEEWSTPQGISGLFLSFSNVVPADFCSLGAHIPMQSRRAKVALSLGPASAPPHNGLSII